MWKFRIKEKVTVTAGVLIYCFDIVITKLKTLSLLKIKKIKYHKITD